MEERSRHGKSEFSRIEARLRDERAAASELDLDQLKLRALSQSRHAGATNRRGQLMKSRLALLSMMVLGLLMSSTGATLAISGSSGAKDAGQGQYREAPGDEVLGDQDEQGIAPNQESGGDDPAGSDPQAAEQTQVVDDAGSDSLPFTGFVALPLLIGGVALLGTGAVLRLKARE